MPPSRAYDALTVLCTAVDVLRRAALINVERSLPPAVYETRLKRSTSTKVTRAAVIEKPKIDTAASDESPVKAADFTIIPNTWSYARPLDDRPTRDALRNDVLSINPDPPNLDTIPNQTLEGSLSEVENILLTPENPPPSDAFDYGEDSEVSAMYHKPCITQTSSRIA